MESFTLENNFIKAVFLTYGAILHQLWIKDSNGNATNVIMGLDAPKEYLSDNWARGAVVGRFAGRLENPININGENVEIEHQKGVLLHSGSSGWHKKEWKTLPQPNPEEITFTLNCISGNSGFPADVQAQVKYFLDQSSLNLCYTAIPTESTHINITNHAYFNLNPKGSIDDQKLKIDADHYLELKQSLVPTGKQLEVSLTEFDFRKSKPIGKTRLDDYFVVNQKASEIASLYSAKTGIEMKTFTDQPGVVIFTPPHFEAICFETQKFSNSPNIPSFPSTLVKANSKYVHNTRFEFSLKNED